MVTVVLIVVTPIICKQRRLMLHLQLQVWKHRLQGDITINGVEIFNTAIASEPLRQT